MFKTDDILRIADTDPIARGSRRHVYAVPGHPDLLVKIGAGPEPKRADGRGRSLLRRAFPLSRHRYLLRELTHEMEVELRARRDPADSPLPRAYGLVNTDLGLGSLFERMRDRSGATAPTLAQVVAERGVDDALLALLDDFAHRLHDHQVAATDVHAGNVVLGFRGGRDRLILIDGYGERTMIPVRELFRWVNDRSLAPRLTRLGRKVGLTWSPVKRTFGRPR